MQWLDFWEGSGRRRPTEKKGNSWKNGGQPYSAQKQPPYLLVVRADLTEGVHSMMRSIRRLGGLVPCWQIAITCAVMREAVGMTSRQGTSMYDPMAGESYGNASRAVFDSAGMPMYDHMAVESYGDALWAVFASAGTATTIPEKVESYHDDLGGWVATEGLSVVAVLTEEAYDDMGSLSKAVQSVRQRGTGIVNPDSDFLSIEELFNRVLVWEPRESRLWPDLSAFGDVGIRRKITDRRESMGVHGHFDPASYAHLDDHCLYAVMFRSLTGQTPSQKGIAWIRWKLISEWRSSDISVRRDVAGLEGKTPSQYECCYLRHRGWGWCQ